MKTLLTTLAFLISSAVFAGPPDGGRALQVPFLIYCHSSENDMVAAIAKSFGEHIALTADVGDHMKLFIFLNEETKTLSIMGTAEESCLIFSGTNVERFDRPTYLPKEGDEET
jgi:hypothetical protein|tara:strand:+ start:336 stop:674 length:339 start_codon:yes stop_codon:yes gene_type:complete